MLCADTLDAAHNCSSVMPSTYPTMARALLPARMLPGSFDSRRTRRRSTSGAILSVQDDGNLVVYLGSKALWASGSVDARLTGGAWCRFDPGAAAQLRELLRAVAAYAAGGREALKRLSRPGSGAAKLLGQMK